MNKKWISVFLLILTTFAGIIVFSILEEPFEILLSPNGKYKVELYGDKKRPWFFTNTVSTKVFDEKKILFSDDIHYGDSFDISFESAYQKYVWVDDNILSFRGSSDQKIADIKNGDSLIIKNNTDNEVRFLKIIFLRNMFFVLNLPSHSSQTVYVNHSDLPERIFIEGEYTDGQRIKPHETNFNKKVGESNNELFKYCASVEIDRILINSSQFEGKTHIGVIIPKIENCL